MKTLIPRTTERQAKISGLIGSLTENENANFVMSAWIAGIQVRKDASGDIHVNLDSSTPCWNDAIATSCPKGELCVWIISNECKKFSQNVWTGSYSAVLTPWNFARFPPMSSR